MNNKYEMDQNNIKFEDLVKVIINDCEIEDLSNIDPLKVDISLGKTNNTI